MNTTNKDTEGLKIRYFETCLLDGSVGFLNLSESDCLLVPPQLHFLSFAQTSSFRKWTKITTNSNPKIQASKCLYKTYMVAKSYFFFLFFFFFINAISYKINICPSKLNFYKTVIHCVWASILLPGQIPPLTLYCLWCLVLMSWVECKAC